MEFNVSGVLPGDAFTGSSSTKTVTGVLPVGVSTGSSSKKSAASGTVMVPKTPPKKEKALPDDSYVPLGDLTFGTACTVRVMVCRKWESTDVRGKPISTDWILSDEHGNAIHCIAMSGVASRIANCLEEGKCCSIKGFTVKPNKERFRLRDGDKCCMHLDGRTEVKPLDCDAACFDRYPFQLTPLEQIALNGNRFLVDVIGVVVRIGHINPTRNNSQLLDIHIQNERGTQIRVTLWGRLCDDFVKGYAAVTGTYIVILPSTQVREWRGALYLSSTSATSIQDGHGIPQIFSFMALLGTEDGPLLPQPIVQQPPAAGTLSQLLILGREQKIDNTQESTTLHCTVRIENVRTTHGWYYFSCGTGRCKKGVSKVGGQFWCDSCSRICEFPQTRYRLHLDISDNTATLPITVFDEIADGLIRKSASLLLEDVGYDTPVDILPQEIELLINTCHVIELKTHTYFNHGGHESFTASRLIRSLPTAKDSCTPTTEPHIGADTTGTTQHTRNLNPVAGDCIKRALSSPNLKRKQPATTVNEGVEG